MEKKIKSGVDGPTIMDTVSEVAFWNENFNKLASVICAACLLITYFF